MATVVGCFILLVAYLMFPGAFHSFFHYVQHMFFSALHSSFGKNPLSGHEHHAQHLHTQGGAGGGNHHAAPGNGGFSGGSNDKGAGK